MARDDWFRNKTWNANIAEAFNKKLKRARHKDQYLRIQALYLSKSNPTVALELLDRFFELDQPYDFGLALAGKADALIALDRIDAASECYEQALEHEKESPNIQGTASIDFPLLIALRQIKERYAQAIEVLERAKPSLMLPREKYDWNCAYALILSDSGMQDDAKSYAVSALGFAGITHSGFRYHPNIGVLKRSECKLDQYRWVEAIALGRSKPRAWVLMRSQGLGRKLVQSVKAAEEKKRW